MRSALSRAIAIVALGLLACGGGIERASFSTDQLSYAVGGRVGLSLVNTSTVPLGINLCLSRLVSSDGAAAPTSNEACDLTSSPLAVGERVDARKSIPAATPPGRWRYETTLRLASGAETVRTQEFEVKQ